MRMLGILLLVSVGAEAQAGTDATDLIRQVSETAKNLRTLRLAGRIVIDTKTAQSNDHEERGFTIAISRPGNMRAEVGDALRICTAGRFSTWIASTKRYTELSHVNLSLCEPVIHAWEKSLENMVEAKIIGQQDVEF